MASQTLRPHRSPSPSPTPTTPVNPSNPAKLMRQSLGPPPTSSSGGARGFSGLGVAAGGATGSAQPRHVSSSVALGMGSSARDSLSPKPGFNNNGTPRAASTCIGRPSSEFLLGGHARDAKTPESEQIDQWFQHLADWEHTLEEMAAASTDQNFTEELGAIEQWFRVLSEAERTAALYSLLQHSTPVQIRFFVNVLQHMSQSDPMTALLSPVAPQQSMQAAMESRLASMNLKSPSAGGGAGFPGSPVASLQASDAAAAAANKSKLRQNRISAPGTLQPSDRWQGQLDQVAERGMSPGIDDTTSNRSRSPAVDSRPKSADFSGQAADQAAGRSPRQASGLGLGLPQPDVSSPITSPFLNGSWASMSSTPLVPMFTDPKIDTIGATLNMANLQLGQAPATRVALDDPRKYRRAGAVPGTAAGRNVSGSYNDDGDVTPSGQPGRATSPLAGGLGMQNWTRSPLLDQYGLGGLGIGGTDQATLAGLGMNMANLNMMGGMNANQMLALAQAQQQLSTAASFAHAGYGGQGGLGMPRMGQGRPSAGRRSPMLGSRGSPTPDRMNTSAAAGAGGGAGGGAGVAGPDDVDERVLADTSGWLRVLRLHKYTTHFASSTWKQMANMTDQDLLDKGVSAQGARTKFLKVFYNVRTHFNMPHPEGSEEYAPGENKEEETK